MTNGLRKTIIGLDIRSRNITAVLVQSSLKGLKLERHISVDIKEPTEKDPSVLSHALKSIISKIDTGGAAYIVSFPFKDLAFRNLTVPFKEKRKIRQILPFETESLFPSSPDEVILDHQPVINDDTPHQTDLVVAAAHQQELKWFLDELASLEIDPEMVTDGPYCTAKVLAENTDVDGFIFVDIDVDSVHLSFCVSGQIRAARRFRILPDTTERPAYVASRVNQTLIAFREQFQPVSSFEKVFVRCNQPDYRDIEKAMTDLLGMPAEPLDLLRLTNLTFEDQSIKTDESAGWQTALALCLAEAHSTPVFNFRKGPFAKQKFWVEHTADLIRTGVFAGIVLLLLFMGFMVESYMLGKQADAIDLQIEDLFKSAFPDATTIHAPLEQMRARIQEMKKTELFSDETESDHRSIDILNEISKLTPQDIDVTISKLTISGGTVLISGDILTFNLVDDLKGRLETSDMFQTVTITSANLDKSGKRVDFKLKLQLS